MYDIMNHMIVTIVTYTSSPYLLIVTYHNQIPLIVVHYRSYLLIVMYHKSHLLIVTYHKSHLLIVLYILLSFHEVKDR